MRGSVICALAVVALAGAASGAALAIPSGVPSGTFDGCPRDPRPLPARPLATYAPTVRNLVLQFVRTSFAHVAHGPVKVAGARTVQVFLVRNWLPSGWIKRECGTTIWGRSVGVVVYFPAMDPPHNPVGHCNSCAVTTFFAARTRLGWAVWGDY